LIGKKGNESTVFDGLWLIGALGIGWWFDYDT